MLVSSSTTREADHRIPSTGHRQTIWLSWKCIHKPHGFCHAGVSKGIYIYNSEIHILKCWSVFISRCPFKTCLEDLVPLITAIVSASLSTGIVPMQLKQAFVIPLLKKYGLDPNSLKHFLDQCPTCKFVLKVPFKGSWESCSETAWRLLCWVFLTAC